MKKRWDIGELSKSPEFTQDHLNKEVGNQSNKSLLKSIWD